jgi:hypothetical protein
MSRFCSLVPKQELGNQINRSISGPALAKELPGKYNVLGELKLGGKMTELTCKTLIIGPAG